LSLGQVVVDRLKRLQRDHRAVVGQNAGHKNVPLDAALCAKCIQESAENAA